MSHVIGQIIFVLVALLFAAGLGGAVLWFGHKPRLTESGEEVSRDREPAVLVCVIAGVFIFAVAAVLASWPTT